MFKDLVDSKENAGKEDFFKTHVEGGDTPFPSIPGECQSSAAATQCSARIAHLCMQNATMGAISFSLATSTTTSVFSLAARSRSLPGEEAPSCTPAYATPGNVL